MANLKKTIINDTGFLRVPVGTTAQRPASLGVAMVRWNTDEGYLELYDGADWVEVKTSGGGLYDFTSATFTSGGTTGRNGPALTAARTGLTGTGTDAWKNNTEFFNTTNGIQLWTVPADGTYRIEAWGAQGADGGSGATGLGGSGARMRGDFALTKGEVFRIVVGQQGITQTNGWGGGGGGGGTFVWNPNSLSQPLIAAGGGGCGGINSINQQDGITVQTGGNGSNNGGAGGTGGNASQSSGICGGGGGQGWFGGPSYHCGGSFTWQPLYTNPDGHLATGTVTGGFGGGGGSWGGGGGGGGWSGGGSAGWANSGFGGGGGSFNSGTNQSNSSGVRSGPGQVQVTLL